MVSFSCFTAITCHDKKPKYRGALLDWGGYIHFTGKSNRWGGDCVTQNTQRDGEKKARVMMTLSSSTKPEKLKKKRKWNTISLFSRKFDDTDCFVTGRHRGDRLLSLRGWQRKWELFHYFLFAFLFLNPERGRASKRKGTNYLIMSIITWG